MDFWFNHMTHYTKILTGNFNIDFKNVNLRCISILFTTFIKSMIEYGIPDYLHLLFSQLLFFYFGDIVAALYRVFNYFSEFSLLRVELFPHDLLKNLSLIFFLWLKVLSQMSHLNSFLFSWTDSICSFKTFFRE